VATFPPDSDSKTTPVLQREIAWSKSATNHALFCSPSINPARCGDVDRVASDVRWIEPKHHRRRAIGRLFLCSQYVLASVEFARLRRRHEFQAKKEAANLTKLLLALAAVPGAIVLGKLSPSAHATCAF